MGKNVNTEKEQVQIAAAQLLQIDKQTMIQQIDPMELMSVLPGSIHFNHKEDLTILWLSDNAEELVGIPPQEIISMGAEYLNEYVHPETHRRAFPNFINCWNTGDPSSVCADYQLIKNTKGEWSWFFTTTKVFKKSDCLLSLTIPTDKISEQIKAIHKNIPIAPFAIKNYGRFQSLTKREKEITMLLGAGKTNKEVSDHLYIALNTVKTHRKRIKLKLDISSNKDWYLYAHHFEI